MSLRYDLGQTEYSHYDEPNRRSMWGAAQTVIWGCIATDIGVITTANAREFYARYVMACRVSGTELDLTPEDVHMMIGLTTNVPTRSRAQFVASMRQHMLAELNDGEREYLRAIYE